MRGLAGGWPRPAAIAMRFALAGIICWSAAPTFGQEMKPGAHAMQPGAHQRPDMQPPDDNAQGMKPPGGHGMGGMQAGRPSFEPATICKQCHEEIYRDWSQSMHAHARKAWYFSHKVASERMGMACYNEKNTAIACETCHEPAGIYPIGAMMQGSPAALAATEGVTCDVCHRITEVKGTGEFKFGAQDTKLGPYSDAKSPYHKTARSALIEKSDFCVACHGQLNNLNGLPVCDTVRTWRQSRYAAEGRTCQSCHMPGAAGPAATGAGAPADAPRNRALHRHVFRGPHSDPSLLREAAKLEQKVARARDGGLEIRARVTNSGTGHDLPSGLPDRLITLKVIAKDRAGTILWQNWREDAYREDRQAAFGLFGFSPHGGPVEPMGAARIDRLSLMPDESRELAYQLPPDVGGKVASVEARLVYFPARPDAVEYFGTWGPEIEPKTMAEVVTVLR
jgi:hypothetical protein